MPTVPAGAEPGAQERFILTLDPQFTGVAVADTPAELSRCTALPSGAVSGLDGWVFDQPVTGGTNPLYIMGFMADVETEPTAILIGVDASGYARIPFAAADGLEASSLGKKAQAQAAGSLAIPPGDELPEGVSAALIDGGAGGAWFRTPAGWVLLAGALGVETEATTPEIFALAGVCAPLSVATPSPASQSPAAPPAAQPGTGLPVTGTAVVMLAGSGLAVLMAGVLMVWVSRRRRAAGDQSR